MPPSSSESCTVFQPGLRRGHAGLHSPNANEGLSAATFAITAVTMTLVANSTPVYLIGFGSRPLDRLTSVIGFRRQPGRARAAPG